MAARLFLSLLEENKPILVFLETSGHRKWGGQRILLSYDLLTRLG